MKLAAADFALFLHITFVITGLCLAAVLHVGLLLLRAARDVAAIRAWPRIVRALEVALPLTALLILLTGAWLLQLSDGEFSWKQGWVTASLVGLLCAETAGAVAGPRSAALRRAINEAPDGPVGADLRQRILDPVLWCILHGGTAIFLAVVFVMVVKPSGLWSAVVIAAVGLLGAVSGVPLSRPTRTGRRASATGHGGFRGGHLWPHPRP